MAASRTRGLRDHEIEALVDGGALDDSEFEDDREDDTEFIVFYGDNTQNNSSNSDTSSEDESPLSELRKRPRTRGGISSRRGQVRTRGGSTRGRDSVNIQSEVNGNIIPGTSFNTPRGRARGTGRIRTGRGRSRGTASSGRQSRNIQQADENIQQVEYDIRDNPERPEWTEDDFHPTCIPFTQPAYLDFAPESFADNFDYFRHYIDHALIETIVTKSNQTHFKNFGKNLWLNESELYVYLGITMVMASINYPKIRMYWEAKYRIPLIADNMPRNRFLQIRNSLKFVYDDDVSREERAQDKLWKIRPLLDKVVAGCRKQVKQKCLSIDEMIIPFTGQCGIKQYVPGKPNPTGLKVFVLANPNGIVCNFTIYQGKTTYPNYEDTEFGLCMKAVLDLSENLAPGHILYFDRYFTTVKLTEELLSRNLLCAGTIMKNRIPSDAKSRLKEDVEMKTEGRGATQVLVNSNHEFALTKWYDNKGVILLSTIHASEPMDTCRRWCKSQRCYVQVERPMVVKAYNENMGGVDLADRLLSVCPNRYRTAKWTQRVFSHMVDLALSNSWLVYKSHKIAQGVPTRQILQLRDFKLDVGESLIEGYTVADIDTNESSGEDENQEARGRGRPSTTQVPSEKKRRMGAKHLPDMVNVQKRCRHCHNMKTYVMCTKCNIYLCFTKNRNCFKNFHS